MHSILVHSTESPQEAEELPARLRAAGIEVEVREQGGGPLAGVIESPRRTWELWVPDASEAAARKVIADEASKLEAERAGLDAELEAEAAAAAPAQSEKPPEPKPAMTVTRNARLAGALIVAGVFLGIAMQIVRTVTADPAPLELETFVRWGIELVVAMALWNGSRGARLLAIAWAVLSGLYYSFALVGLPPIAPLLHVSQSVALCALLIGGDGAGWRYSGAALWVVTNAVSWFPLAFAPAVLTHDSLAGQWHRTRFENERVAFCRDGKFASTHGGLKRGTWRRVGLYEVAITLDDKDVERHLYTAMPNQLIYLHERWAPDHGESLCGESQ